MNGHYTPICKVSGKIQHSRSDAQRSMAGLKVLNNDADVQSLNIYKCTSCGRWHVGHNHQLAPVSQRNGS